MASIEIGSGSSGKKAVDANIPLVPFIDLLLCCVMFLLVTAVWNQLASLDAQLNTPGDPTADRIEAERIQLLVSLHAHGYELSSTAGDRLAIPRVGEQQDVTGLCARLDEYRKSYPNERAITLAADDGIAFDAVVATMDALRSRGFSAITL